MGRALGPSKLLLGPPLSDIIVMDRKLNFISHKSGDEYHNYDFIILNYFKRNENGGRECVKIGIIYIYLK